MKLISSSYLAIIMMILALFASPLNAAILYWDGTDTTADADGGAGTWDTTTNNWDSAPTAGTNQIWNNATPDSATFGGTAGTVTLGTGITIGGLTFNDNAGYLITGSTITLGAASIITANVSAQIDSLLDTATFGLTFSGAGNLTVSNAISNGTTLIKNDAGILTLTGTNGFTGATVNGGTITGGTLSLSGGATALASSATSAVNSNVTITTAAGTITSSAGTLTLGGTVNASSLALTFDGAGDTTVSNGIANGTTLSKSGAGILTLSGNNTLSGATTVNGGTLVLNNPTTNGFTSAITINSTGTVELGAANKVVDTAVITVNAGGTFDLNGKAETIARTAGTGSVTNSGALATLIMTGSTGTVANSISGALTLSIQGASKTYTLNGPNTYTGSTTIGTGGTAGTKVILGSSTALPSGTAVTVDGNTATTVLDLNGFNATVGLLTLGNNTGSAQTGVVGISSKLTLTAGAKLDGHNNGAGLISVSTLDLNGATQTFTTITSNSLTSNLTISSVIQNGGVIIAGRSTTQGPVAFTGTNTYTGNTTINSGLLQLGNFRALQNSNLVTSATSKISLTAGAGAYTFGGLSGSTNLATVLLTNATSLTNLILNPGVGASNTYSGIIANGAANMVLTKTGAGTQALAGASTYSGGTNVNAGVLLVQNTTGSGVGSGAVAVAMGATHGTLGGTGIINTTSLTVNGDGTVPNNGALRIGNTDNVGGVASALKGNLTVAGATNATLGGMVQFDIFSRTSATNTFGSDNNDLLTLSGSGTVDFGSTAIVKVNDVFAGGLGSGTGGNLLAANDSWKLIDWTSFSGTHGTELATFDLPSLSGYTWDTTKFYTLGTISLVSGVPEPSRAILMLFGAAGLLLRRRRKTA